MFALVLVMLGGCSGGSSVGSSASGGANNPTTVTFNFRGAMPTVVAAKIGSGVFTAQTFNSGVLSFSIPSGASTFAVAYLCPAFSGGSTNPTQTYQFVIEASTADGTSFSPPPCPHLASPDPPGTLTGSIDASSVAGTSVVFIEAGSGSTLTNGTAPATGNFSFSAPVGNDRVEVLAYGNAPFSNYGGLSLVAARNFGSQTVPGELNGGNTVVLSTGDAVTQQPITYDGVPSGFTAPTTLVLAAMGAGEFLVSTTATNLYPALPAAAVESGDFYHFKAVTRSSTSNGQVLGVETTTTGGGPATLSFPAPWVYAGPTPTALPSFHFDYPGFSKKNGIFETGIIEWSAGNSVQDFYQVSATGNYQSGTADVSLPDLSGISGFLAAPASKTVVAWAAEETQQNGGAFQTLAANITASTVENVGSFTVP